MTRVLVIEAAGNLWGSERSLLDLLSSVPRLDVVVCCPPGTPLMAELKKRRIRVLPYYVSGLHEKSRGQRMRAALGVLRACLEFRPDVLHLNQGGSYKIALPSARLLRIPIIAHIRIFEDAAYLAQQRPDARELACVVAISGAVQDELKRFTEFRTIPIELLYNTYISQPAGRQDAGRQRNRVACVGRLVPIKGQHVLLEALALLMMSGQDIECLVAGDGDESFIGKLKAKADENRTSSRIEWLGFVGDIPPLLRTCSVLVCPSHREPLGRVILEAWDAGAVPVVFAGSGGAAEIVAAARGGIVYDEQTPESLANALRQALALDDDERSGLVDNGRQWMAANCNPTAYGEAVSVIMAQASRPQARRDLQRSAPRIIFVPFIDAFGGVERLILGLSRFLHEQGLAHTVVCFAETLGLGSYARWPIAVHQLRPARNPFVESWTLHQYLNAAHALGAPAPLLFDLKGAFYAGLFHMPPYHLHLTDPPSLLQVETSNRAFSLRQGFKPDRPARIAAGVRGEIVHRINKRGAVRARSVIAMSDFIADELRTIYSIVPTVVRPGVEPLPRSISGPRKTDAFRALSVCRLEPNKRVDWILRAWARLGLPAFPLDSASNWRLDIVGDGSQRERLQALAEELGIAANVVFHGAVSDEHLDELFRSAQLFLMPAAQGYGLPALEALARGVPVVLHRESGVSEILGDTPWAEIINDGVDELTQVMQTMMHRISAGEIESAVVPPFPTETDWAREVSSICEWV